VAYCSPLAPGPSAESSPLSSDTTALQTAGKVDPGSSVNDGSPWYDVKNTIAGSDDDSVHMVIHTCGQDSHLHAAGYSRRPAGPALKTTDMSQLVENRSAILASLSSAAPVWNGTARN
jgi:hypothetical protein